MSSSNVQSKKLSLFSSPNKKRNTHRLSGSVATSAAPARPSAPRPTTAELMPPEATAASPKSPNTPRGGAGPRRVEEGAANARRAAGAAREETARAVPAVDDVRLPFIAKIFETREEERTEEEEEKRNVKSEREKRRKNSAKMFPSENQAVADPARPKGNAAQRGEDGPLRSPPIGFPRS